MKNASGVGAATTNPPYTSHGLSIRPIERTGGNMLWRGAACDGYGTSCHGELTRIACENTNGIADTDRISTAGNS